MLAARRLPASLPSQQLAFARAYLHRARVVPVMTQFTEAIKLLAISLVGGLLAALGRAGGTPRR